MANGVFGSKSTVTRLPTFTALNSLPVTRKRLFMVTTPLISVYIEVPLRSALRQAVSLASKLVTTDADTVPVVSEDESVNARTS